MSEVLGRRRARPRQPVFPSVTRRAADPATARQDEGGLLPIPPDDSEKYSYAKRGTRAMAIFSICSFFLVAYTQVLLTRLSPWMWSYVPFLAFTIIYILVSQISTILTRDFDLTAHKKLVDDWRPETYPAVDVFLPVCGEPDAVLRNTWENVAPAAGALPRHRDGLRPRRLLQPAPAAHGRQVRVRLRGAGPIAAGSRRPATCSTATAISHARLHPRAGRGLRAAARPAARGDPVHGGGPDRRHRAVAQFFRVLDQQTWLERGAGAVQELFYRSVQTSQSTWDAAVCVGSCAVYRRAALEENSGIDPDRALRGRAHRLRPATCGAGTCATCRSRCPQACARTTYRRTSTSSTAGARAR